MGEPEQPSEWAPVDRRPKTAETLLLYSTCVESADLPAAEYAHHVREVARWSERVGCAGMLIYTDNRLVDPWLVAQLAIEATERLRPLVATQPVYMHPYSVAKMVASFGSLFGRRIALNMLAGGFRNDLLALGDDTPHDRRYDRMVEYTTIVTGLLEGSVRGEPFSFAGEFYRVEKLRLTPALTEDLQPQVFVSGSSPAGLAAARALGALAVQYPTHPERFGDVSLETDIPYGIRVGIVARPKEDEAWAVAEGRFPVDRKGRLTRQLADKTSDSAWHHDLVEQAADLAAEERSPYWMVPFEQYRTMCPYLVGTYEQVAELLRTYVDKGYRTFILDIPPSLEELEHTCLAFEQCGGSAR